MSPSNPEPQSLLMQPALYYPYIHVKPRHLDWLKETLLCFRQVRRMVPVDFALHDAPDIARLRDIDVPDLGPMLAEEPLDRAHVFDAQATLLDRLRRLTPAKLAQFSRERALADAGGVSKFEIYRGKLTYELLRFLQLRDAAWHARERGGDDGRDADWVAVHPRMGEAIMSVMALAVADAKQLNIVTTDGDVHRALATRDDTEVFDALLEPRDRRRPRARGSRDQVVNGAMQLIISKQMDLSWVSLDDIAAIIRDGNDFQRFRIRLQELAANVAVAPDPDERAKQIAALANEARAEWDDYRKSLGSFKRMFVDTAIADGAWPGLTMFGAAALGYASLGVAAVGGGLLLGLAQALTKTAVARRVEARAQPYRYLSRLTKAGAVLVSDLPSLPPT